MRYEIIQRIQCLFLFLLAQIMGTSSYAQTRVEGLFYLDKTPVSVEIKDGRIVSVQRIEKLTNNNSPVYVAPGLVDNQVNGYAGVSFCFDDSSLQKENMRMATNELWKKGVTTYLPTLTTNSREVLLKNLSILTKLKEDEALLGSMAGFHLEGPYISAEDGYRGAHMLKQVRLPDWDEFMAFYKASGENIATVTLAPELEGRWNSFANARPWGLLLLLGITMPFRKSLTTL